MDLTLKYFLKWKSYLIAFFFVQQAIDFLYRSDANTFILKYIIPFNGI